MSVGAQTGYPPVTNPDATLQVSLTGHAGFGSKYLGVYTRADEPVYGYPYYVKEECDETHFLYRASDAPRDDKLGLLQPTGDWVATDDGSKPPIIENGGASGESPFHIRSSTSRDCERCPDLPTLVRSGCWQYNHEGIWLDDLKMACTEVCQTHPHNQSLALLHAQSPYYSANPISHALPCREKPLG